MREYPEYKPEDRRGRCMLVTDHKIAYINNPRVASSSCKEAMRRFGEHELHNYLEEQIDLDRYFTFSIVRDPISRFISTFLWLSYGREWWRNRSREYRTRDKDFFKHKKLDQTKMHLFISEVEKDFWDPHTQPQCWWLADKDFNLLKLDHIFVIEPDLSATFAEFFREKFKIRAGLPRILPTPEEKKEVAERIFKSTPEFLERIKRIYACDFELYEKARGANERT